MVQLNLPPKQDTSSSDKVNRYFSTYYGYQLEFPSNDVDAVIGFLENKGFDTVAAQSTGSVLLQQAKIDGIKVFTRTQVDLMRNSAKFWRLQQKIGFSFRCT